MLYQSVPVSFVKSDAAEHTARSAGRAAAEPAYHDVLPKTATEVNSSISPRAAAEPGQTMRH